MEVLAELYPLLKNSPALSGKVILFDQVCSFRKNTHRAVREERDTHLAS